METVTNENIYQIDWSRNDRQRFLASFQKVKQRASRSQKEMAMRNVCGTDVSGNDPRSVKAYLAGRGDHRVFWWKLNFGLHRLIKPSASLEKIMLGYHTRHYHLTCAVLDFLESYIALRKSIAAHGLVNACTEYFSTHKANF